jgi:hypothetical protein
MEHDVVTPCLPPAKLGKIAEQCPKRLRQLKHLPLEKHASQLKSGLLMSRRPTATAFRTAVSGELSPFRIWNTFPAPEIIWWITAMLHRHIAFEQMDGRH